MAARPNIDLDQAVLRGHCFIPDFGRHPAFCAANCIRFLVFVLQADGGVEVDYLQAVSATDYDVVEDSTLN